jgi:hypothetical protein
VLWIVSQTDAMRICSDSRNSSRHHMLVWSDDGVDDPEVGRFVRDNGMFARVLAEHGVTVLRSLAHPGS